MSTAKSIYVVWRRYEYENYVLERAFRDRTEAIAFAKELLLTHLPQHFPERSGENRKGDWSGTRAHGDLVTVTEIPLMPKQRKTKEGA